MNDNPSDIEAQFISENIFKELGFFFTMLTAVYFVFQIVPL